MVVGWLDGVVVANERLECVYVWGVHGGEMGTFGLDGLLVLVEQHFKISPKFVFSLVVIHLVHNISIH